MAGTVVKQGPRALAVADISGYPALAGPEALTDVLQTMADNVGDQLNIFDLTRIKMPIGGSTTWEIEDEFDDPTMTKDLHVVMVHWEAPRVLFPRNPDGSARLGEAPGCSSADGRYPIHGGRYGDGGVDAAENPPVSAAGGPARRTCETCPMSQWGSNPKGGRGQACQSRRLLFILREGDLLPAMISAPPTSIKNLRKAMIALTTRYQVHHSGMVLSLQLERAELSGNPFAKIKLRPVGKLEGARPLSKGGPEQGSPAWVAYQYSQEIGKLLTAEAIVQVTAVSLDEEAQLGEQGLFSEDEFADHGDAPSDA